MSNESYPVEFQVEYPQRSSRLWALFSVIPLKFVALIIHWLVMIVFSLAMAVVFFISQIIVLFAGRYPEGMHTFMVKVLRWQMQISAFSYGLRDEFPPFAPSKDPSAVTLTMSRPETSSRGWAIMTMLGIKALALLPHSIILGALSLAMVVIWFVSQIAVLFTGRFPQGMHDFIVGVLRWSTRVTAFSLGLCDRYPPFSLK